MQQAIRPPMLLAFPNAPLDRSSKHEGTAEEAADGILEPPDGEGIQPIKPLKALQTGRLLALIAGSHEAAGAASAERQSVTGLMVDTVGGWSQMSLSLTAKFMRKQLQGERRGATTDVPCWGAHHTPPLNTQTVMICDTYPLTTRDGASPTTQRSMLMT